VWSAVSCPSFCENLPPQKQGKYERA
jgi:hypothetical protein